MRNLDMKESDLDAMQSGSPRQLYRRAELSRLFDPASIAIVGSSPRAGSFGSRVAENLSGYTGRLFHVNPRYESIGDAPCFASIEAIGEVPDCVVLVTSSDNVEMSVAECVRLGVGGVVIFAAGYAETGKPEDVDAQRRLVQMVRGTSTRLVGPNCIGLFNYVRGVKLSFSPGAPTPAPAQPAVGIVSQSGAMGTALAQVMEHGTAISHTLTAGNMCDVDVADMVAYLAEDEDCAAIACVFEGLAAPRRFLDAARLAWSNDKPLIVYKMATGAKGAAAAMSHTGSLAGENSVYRAAFEAAGAVQVDSHEDLIETAMFFAKAPRMPLAAGAAIVSTSGGAGIIAADKAEEEGVPLPDLAPETEAVLAANVPDFGSPRNPCDLTAQVLNDPIALNACAEAILRDPAVGVLVYPHPLAYDAATPRMAAMGALARRYGKPFCTVWVNGWLEGPGSSEAERNADVILFRSMSRCFGAIARWQARAARRAAEAAGAVDVAPNPDRAAVSAALTGSATRTIGEAQAKSMLARYGVPAVPERLVNSLDELRAVAAEIGFPLVMKVESPDIPHKTESGMVHLNLPDIGAAEAAYADILSKAEAMSPQPRLNGVVVQAMVSSGLELVVGGRVDPQFGPIVVFGLGGVLVELLCDTVTALAPISAATAESLVTRLRGHDLLKGFRNSAPVDIGHFAAIVAGVSQFLSDHRDIVAEVDVNPLIASPRGLLAVDALIVLDREPRP